MGRLLGMRWLMLLMLDRTVVLPWIMGRRWWIWVTWRVMMGVDRRLRRVGMFGVAGLYVLLCVCITGMMYWIMRRGYLVWLWRGLRRCVRRVLRGWVWWLHEEKRK